MLKRSEPPLKAQTVCLSRKNSQLSLLEESGVRKLPADSGTDQTEGEMDFQTPRPSTSYNPHEALRHPLYT